MIESVLEQSYGNLELCIADGSPSDQVRRTAEEYARRDSRVRYRKLSENLGISGNTNAALAEASGDYVGLLDHDDLLLPGALFEIVRALNIDGGSRQTRFIRMRISWIQSGTGISSPISNRISIRNI